MTHAYTRMPVSLRMALVYAQDAAPEMREVAQRYIQHPTVAQFARARELELEPMPGDARATGAEDRALYPFHADVQGLGVCPDALLIQPGAGTDVETLEMYRDRRAFEARAHA